MNRDEIVASCHRQAEAWNAHDSQAIARFYAEDATLHDAGGQTATGRAAIAERARLYLDAFPDMRLEVGPIEVDGNTCTMEWTARGTHGGSLAGMPPTGRAVVVEGCDVAQFGEDSLIHSETDYWNEAAMMRQLGLMPEAATAG
jgi:steroid delta-isomerase-like uncharacterized protein